MAQLLNDLTKFYRNESLHIPHRDEDLFDVAYSLAEFMRARPGIFNAGRLDTDVADDILDDPDAFVTVLIEQHTTTLIDTAVNLLHHALIESLDDECAEAIDVLFAEDIRQYLLHRNDPGLLDELRAEREAEEQLDEFEAVEW